jgi:antitoxin VapB
VWGCAAGSGLQLIKDEDRVFEERPLLWDDPEWRAKYMPDA